MTLFVGIQLPDYVDLKGGFSLSFLSESQNTDHGNPHIESYLQENLCAL